jgi:hypothetical protein
MAGARRARERWRVRGGREREREREVAAFIERGEGRGEGPGEKKRPVWSPLMAINGGFEWREREGETGGGRRGGDGFVSMARTDAMRGVTAG